MTDMWIKGINYIFSVECPCQRSSLHFLSLKECLAKSKVSCRIDKKPQISIETDRFQAMFNQESSEEDPTAVDALFTVEPDSEGSYAAYKMKTTQPTQDMLNPENTYQLASKCKGLAFILNNNKQREGSQIDMANMIHLFKELGYTPLPYENLEGKDITGNFKTFASLFNQKGVSYDSAVIVLMSHGDKDGVILGTDKVKVKLQDLHRELEQGDGLAGKPKIYFVQACRGSEYKFLPIGRMMALSRSHFVVTNS
ncbi:cell death protein 3-like [Patiria miniata]|uniref:Caspase family p20 domain-containing protein n=1 Tax=Patiria miniata TaxID=46514 RepID=A0A914AB50_PATMI|nr:cell death protein 3-like [Patiria miniata]